MRRGRLRSCWRWGVTLIAAVLVVGTVLSWFYYLRLGYAVDQPRMPGEQRVWSEYSAVVGEGRIWVDLLPRCSDVFRSEPSSFGFQSDLNQQRSIYRAAYWMYGDRIWGLEIDRSNQGGSHTRIYLSGFVPAGIFGLLSAWSWIGVLRRRNKLREGGCQACGYSLAGLDGGVCPECGEGAEDMEESKTTPEQS